eukprot:scaffold3382_cov58-Phaeocystis_antarctica.AAC.6
MASADGARCSAVHARRLLSSLYVAWKVGWASPVSRLSRGAGGDASPPAHEKRRTDNGNCPPPALKLHFGVGARGTLQSAVGVYEVHRATRALPGASRRPRLGQDWTQGREVRLSSASDGGTQMGAWGAAITGEAQVGAWAAAVTEGEWPPHQTPSSAELG